MSYCNHCARYVLMSEGYYELIWEGHQSYPVCYEPACKAWYAAQPQEKKEKPPSPVLLPRFTAHLAKLDQIEAQMDKIIEDTDSLSESEEDEEISDEQWEAQKSKVATMLQEAAENWVDNMREEAGLPRVYYP